MVSQRPNISRATRSAIFTVPTSTIQGRFHTAVSRGKFENHKRKRQDLSSYLFYVTPYLWNFFLPSTAAHAPALMRSNASHRTMGLSSAVWAEVTAVSFEELLELPELLELLLDGALLMLAVRPVG